MGRFENFGKDSNVFWCTLQFENHWHAGKTRVSEYFLKTAISKRECRDAGMHFQEDNRLSGCHMCKIFRDLVVRDETGLLLQRTTSCSIYHKEGIPIPIGLLWVLEVVYSTAGNIVPTLRLSGAKHYPPPVNKARVGMASAVGFGGIGGG